MQSKKLFVYGLAAYFAFGILAGFLVNPSFQTLMACPCGLQEAENSTHKEEIACNSVTTTNYLFYTGFLNLYQEKEGQEIIMCEDGERVGEEVRYNQVSGIKISSFLMPQNL